MHPWIGLDWVGLDWIGLDWIGSNVGKTWMDWIGLDWILQNGPMSNSGVHECYRQTRDRQTTDGQATGELHVR